MAHLRPHGEVTGRQRERERNRKRIWSSPSIGVKGRMPTASWFHFLLMNLKIQDLDGNNLSVY